jgi:hypothetical protein
LDLACLEAHVHLKNPVQQLTAAAVNKLQKYWLTDELWDLADDLVDVLAISSFDSENSFHQLMYFRYLRGLQSSSQRLKFLSLQMLYQCLRVLSSVWLLSMTRQKDGY